ncbi:MAG: type II toxin-antitoxin system VapC family toxin [Verrucomicrobiota bacterium]|nr:type II toxin-antitoxin system VapC family toxin [Verrucomicrobiota bacterium]
MKAVFDTNILVDYLNGVSAANRELDQYEEIAISVVTWMEVLAGADDAEEEAITRQFLSRFNIQTVEKNVAERVIKIRRLHKLKLPDAIIWATAKELGRILVTRNTKDFSEKDAGIRVPYKIYDN